MDDLRLVTDPARIDAAIREARRLRNAVLRDLVLALFDGRLLARLTDGRQTPSHDLPHGAAPQG